MNNGSIISKELLSEVFNKEIKYDNIKINEVILIDGFNIIYGRKNNCCDEILPIQINIYELAHKCKEWADNRGYIVVAYISDSKGWADLKYERNFKQVHDLSTFRAETEVEAIFAACQWILDNKDKK